MKKTVLTLLLLASLLPSQVYAALTPTVKKSPTLTPKVSGNEVSTDSADLDRIKKIKDLVADKVAKLKLVEKRGILGIVQEVSNTQLTIEDSIKNEGSSKRIIDIDELTKFQDSGSTSKSFGISDIKEGNELAFIGLYNKDTKRLLARFVIRVKAIPIYFEGVVTDLDTKNFRADAVDAKGNAKTIDYQTSTKTQSYDKADGLVKSGFSKISIGERIFAAGFADPDNKTYLLPTRVIHFLDIPPSLDMKRFEKIDSEEVPISTGSGKKLVPLTR